MPNFYLYLLNLKREINSGLEVLNIQLSCLLQVIKAQEAGALGDWLGEEKGDCVVFFKGPDQI